MVGRNAEIITRDPLVVGKNFLLGEGVVIDNCDSSGCFIGNEVAIARGSYIRTGNHSFNRSDLPIMFQGHTSQTIFYDDHQYSVVIEDDVWIGANVVILSGTHISRGCVIAAGSVLMGFVPPLSIFAGNPGRVIGKRD
jgi:galactoside O-acetyltransferase